MSPNNAFNWTPAAREAVQLVAEDKITDERIAGQVGIAKRTLERWKLHPEFAAQVAQRRAEIAERIRTTGIAIVTNRVAAQHDRWLRMQRVIEERAEQYAGADAPGAGTGLLVKTEKAIGSGFSSVFVDEWAVDTGLLREIREHEKQAAIELKQWTEQRVLSGDPDNPLTVKGQFDFDSFGGIFADLAGVGTPTPDGVDEPLDPAYADAETGGLPGATNP